MSTLILRMSETSLAGLHGILEMGGEIQTTAGVTLRELLCDRLVFDRNYIDKRVQTIFHNFKAVDRIDQVRIEDGDVVALSAAMPGLAGATLRKAGVLAAFRKDISHSDTAEHSGSHQKASVTLKLFNLVAQELGAHLLRQGVWVRPDRLLESLGRFDPATFSGPQAIVYNGSPATLETLPQLCRSGETIFLSIEHPV
jgi:hypothetical protein